MTDAQIAGGHKAAINNPNVSKEAKEHSKKVLNEEFDGGDVPKASEDDSGKNPGNVAGGLKAAINNPNVSEEAKESAQERLNDMGK
ncbi:Conidiation protein 6-domain-containing protein [Thelonectria olida]|uniref:Conidiation protein 6-domain-containing protein n=1 Tax=Thelonectria olida TaxID=1576542 RepID=A0A9P9AX08_9HYPO|nr:Conidiation protein 6-domain-containing protein [Thelonectria olida]